MSDLDVLRRLATNKRAWEDLTHYIYGLYHSLILSCEMFAIIIPEIFWLKYEIMLIALL